MANLEDEVTSQPLNIGSDFTFEELRDAFNELLGECEHMNMRNNVLKKKLSSLENEVKNLKIEKENFEKERNVILNEKECLQKENKDMKESLEKLVEGKKKLEMILGTQKNFGDKQGIGFDPFQASSSKTIFVKASNQNYVQRKPSFKPMFSKRSITCHYCGKNGHSIKKCFIRNYP